jgi:hypothetical protein
MNQDNTFQKSVAKGDTFQKSVAKGVEGATPLGVEGTTPLNFSYQHEYYVKNKERIYANQLRYYRANKYKIKIARRNAYFQRKLDIINKRADAFRKALKDGTYKPLFNL